MGEEAAHAILYERRKLFALIATSSAMQPAGSHFTIVLDKCARHAARCTHPLYLPGDKYAVSGDSAKVTIEESVSEGDDVGRVISSIALFLGTPNDMLDHMCACICLLAPTEPENRSLILYHTVTPSAGHSMRRNATKIYDARLAGKEIIIWLERETQLYPFSLVLEEATPVAVGAAATPPNPEKPCAAAKNSS